jgi:hypothetical protein
MSEGKVYVNFGFFDYQNISSNIGDDVQTLAMIGILKKMNEIHSLKFPSGFDKYNCIINPEAKYILNMIPINRDFSSKTPQNIQNIICVMNGWFMHKIDTPKGRSKFTGLSKRKLFNNDLDWPPPSNIKPIFISFHINNKDMLDECYIPYYKLNEPIGCRDRSTAKYLANKGINSYFLKIEHDGDLTRVEKLKYLLTKDIRCLNYLRVCYKNKRLSKYNCTNCEKCLRTLYAIQILGYKDKAITFDKNICGEKYWKFRPKNNSSKSFQREIKKLLQESK